MVEVERLTAYKNEENNVNNTTNSNGSNKIPPSSNQSMSFFSKYKSIYNSIFSKKGQRDRNMSTRNRISFFLTVYSLMHAIDFFTLDNEEIYNQKESIRAVFYAFIVTFFMVIFSLKGTISKAYIINFPIFARCVWYIIYMIEQYLKSKFNGGEDGKIADNSDL